MCLKLKSLVILLIILYQYDAFRLKFTNLVCDSFNKSWVVYKECRLRALSRNKTTLTAFVYVSEPAYNIFVRGQMLKKANGFKPWVMDYMIDACKFMKHKHHPFANFLWSLFKDVSTINHTCPYVGLQGLKDFYKIDKFPSVFPNGEYLLNLTWLFDKKPQFVTSVYFSLWEDIFINGHK